jgi:NAD(P)H-hydrate epimerase
LPPKAFNKQIPWSADRRLNDLHVNERVLFMKVATAAEMREIDRRTIEEYGIPGMVLMERAGTAAARLIGENFDLNKVTVLSGSGNNGGDGLVIARELHNRGYGVRVLMVGNRRRLSADCRAQLEIARKMGVSMEFRAKLKGGDLHGALAVDAVFGTGLSKEIEGPIASLISTLNRSGRPVVSVDIPSGVSADTGEVPGIAVTATQTVTFGLPKRGHLLHPGAGHTGELFIEDIGFPRELSSGILCNLPGPEDMALLIPPRGAYSHKGEFGHVLLLAGSTGKTGAALMAARACLRCGAGLVTIGAPETLIASMQSSVTEEMLMPLPDTGEGALSMRSLDTVLGFLDDRADILAMGPGIGGGAETRRLVHGLLGKCTVPMVVDADGINALEGNGDLLGRARAPVLLTPHPGEFSRLTGTPKRGIERDRVEAASAFSTRTGVYVILKGAPTVVAEPGGETFINPTGNPAMAKAGTGDVLTGMAAALLGQGLSPLEASILAVYAHGTAGDIAASRLGLHSVLASDIIGALPETFKSIGRADERHDIS